MEFFIVEKNGIDIEVQKERNKITSIRIGKITSVLYEKQPSDLLPFKGQLPLVSANDQSHFLKKTMQHHLFEDCDADIKMITYKAEKIKFFHDLFCDYLSSISLSHADFKRKNPKMKLDILYDFLFANKADVGVLEI